MSNDVILTTMTGDHRSDTVLRHVVGAFLDAFPGHIRGCYVDGSGADGTLRATSDLDVTVVVDRFTDAAEQERGNALARRLAMECTIELDLTIRDEADLARGVFPAFKTGSLCVWGEDIRARVPLLPIDAWTRDRMHSSYYRLGTLFGRQPVVRSPLDYPDPDGEFFGYDHRTIRLPDGTEVPSTRDLIRATGWTATALIAHCANRYVDRKSACHVIYRACFNDEWGDLLAAIYHRCRNEWGYRVPESVEGRAALRAICARTLAFENHFLNIYTPFLIRELHEGDTARKAFALWMLGKIVYLNDPVIAIIQMLAEDSDAGVRAAAIHAIRQVEQVAW